MRAKILKESNTLTDKSVTNITGVLYDDDDDDEYIWKYMLRKFLTHRPKHHTNRKETKQQAYNCSTNCLQKSEFFWTYIN